MSVEETPDITYTVLNSGSSAGAIPVTAPAVTSSDSYCLLTTKFEVQNLGTGEWEDYEGMGGSQPAWI